MLGHRYGEVVLEWSGVSYCREGVRIEKVISTGGWDCLVLASVSERHSYAPFLGFSLTCFTFSFFANQK